MATNVSNPKPSKVCALCGRDCSKRKRAKDAEGRYYCLSCFERRLEEVRRRRLVEDELEGSTAVDAVSMSDSFHVDAELIEAEVPKVDPETTVTIVPCPGCGLSVEQNSLVCVHCGFDFDADRQMKTKKRVLSREGEMRWPTVLGLACVVFGIGGVLMHGSLLVRAMIVAFDNFDASLAYVLLHVGGAGLMTLLAAGLAIGGAFVWLRLDTGVTLLRGWLWTKLMLFAIALLVGGVALLVFTSNVAQLSIVQEMALRIDETTRLDLAGDLALLCLWQCAWPVVLLYFLETEQVKKDIKSWGEPIEKSTRLYD